MSLHIQCRKPVIKLRTTDAGVDGTPNSLTGAGLETVLPAGDLMKAVLFFPVSQTETRVRFSFGAFVQPSDGAQLTGNRVELRVFPREPFTISVRAGLKAERIWRAQCGWATHLYTFTHGALVHALFHWGLSVRLKKKKKSPVSVQLRALNMEMQRWTTRWKTKRWLWDSTLTVAVTVVLILQAVIVRAGKKLMPEWPPVRQAGSRSVWQSVRGRPSTLMTPKLSLPHESDTYCRLYQSEQLISVY